VDHTISSGKDPEFKREDYFAEREGALAEKVLKIKKRKTAILAFLNTKKCKVFVSYIAS